MTAPGWLHTALASLMLAVAAGLAVRLGLARRRGWRSDLGGDVLHPLHPVMSVAMAGMFLPRLSLLPAAVWAIGFGVAAAWFGWRVITAGRGPAAPSALVHLIECAAMLFMLLPVVALAPGSALVGPVAVLALLLALAVVGCALWATDTLVSGLAATPVSDRLAAGGRIAMSVAMGYMLIQMV